MATHSHTTKTPRAWVVDVNMGYGHSRAAYALKDLSGGVILSANDYPGIPAEDQKYWRESRKIYEFISRMKPIPVVGNFLFEAMDYWQQIPDFYPRRDLSKPNAQLKQIFYMIKKGFGKHLIEKLSENPLPFVTTFFISAFFADYYDYPGEIWCVTTDADISRAWAPIDPKSSRIKYLASNGRVVERLKLYGVRADHIFLTGFPLPKELVGGPKDTVVKNLLADRLCNLDPNGIFHDRYQRTLKEELGPIRCKKSSAEHPLTLTYSVGGAGAQRALGVKILQSLKSRIARHEIRLNLMAGYRKDGVLFYRNAVKELGLKKELGTWVNVPEHPSRAAYFQDFTDVLKTTDILWTKPSEMSFYCGLGIAIVMAPPIGSQEEFNRVWLTYMGGGVSQNDPRYTDEWLFDWIASGGVARMAWSGYIEAPTHGTYRIEDLVLGRESEIHPLPLIV
ncbi:hypothetical protein HQ487_04595 [Candidatus Uhrbacteria bacterium]|nr:hypothetical protein [Candidatus Uhrbacteria bacterium]